jgi:hypothetical protein
MSTNRVRPLKELPLQLSPRDPRFRNAIAKSNQALQAYALTQVKTNPKNKEREAAGRTIQAAFEEKIATSPAAKRALRTLDLHPLQDLDLKTKFPALNRLGVSQTARTGPWPFPSVQVRVRPYDWDWVWGNPMDTEHQKLSGDIAAIGGSGNVGGGTQDPVNASAGIGIVITSNRYALVYVQAFIFYSWMYGVLGPLGSGWTKGGIEMAATHDGNPLDGPRRTELFSESASFSPERFGGQTGTMWATVSFNMAPGDLVLARFGAWVECDHLLPKGAGLGHIEGTVEEIYISRFNVS